MSIPIVVVFHKDCKASTDFIALVSTLQDFAISTMHWPSDVASAKLDIKAQLPHFISITK